MHLYKAVIAVVLLSAAPAIKAEVNFEQYDALTTPPKSNPNITQAKWNVTVAGMVTGLGKSKNLLFNGFTVGYIETQCINGGSKQPPGKNKETIELSGSVTGTTSDVSTGSYSYTLEMKEDCSCGIGEEGKTFPYKNKGVTTTLNCIGGPFDYLTGDKGVCCDVKRAGDEIDCGDCECRVGDYVKNCTVSKKNENFAQYAIGIRVNNTIVDLVVREANVITTIKRQVCFAKDGNYGKVENTDQIKPTDVACFQCKFCPTGNGNNQVPCVNEYPGTYPALKDGCAGYVTVPVNATGPIVEPLF